MSDDDELTGGLWVRDARGVWRWVVNGPEPEPEPDPEPEPEPEPVRRKTPEHGTTAGYRAHKDKTGRFTEADGWPRLACEPCLAAKRNYQNDLKDRTKRRWEEGKQARG